MRESLWPGLVRAAQTNLHRQQERLKLFEIGPCFRSTANGETVETPYVSGLAIGTRLPVQWGEKSLPVDVFDVKADLEALLGTAGGVGIAFENSQHPALHPGRSARILAGKRSIGWLGEIHPALALEFDVPAAILFEIAADALGEKTPPVYRPISKFPSVRRDIAVIVAREVSSAAILAAVQNGAPDVLTGAFVFDIYMGPQVGAEEKSVAIGLILQDTSRTLTDEDSERAVSAITAALAREFKARIRE
jgi:phenylalanyl-tRNA synthetase beta chain